MVFHIARSADIFGVGRAARKFVEDDAIGLGHHIGEHVEATAMRHAIDDFANAQMAAIFDDCFERGDHRLAAIKAETLGADIFLGEEFLVLLGLDHLGEDRLLALGRKGNGSVPALHPLLQETPFLDIGDVHIFKANRATIIGAQRCDQFANADPIKAQRAADIDLTVEIGICETMIGGVEVGRDVLLGKTERVEIGGQMPAHTIGAHQHHRADRIARGCNRIALRHRLASRLCRRLDLDRHLCGVERAGQLVGFAKAPVGALPAWAALRFKLMIFKTHWSCLSRGGGKCRPFFSLSAPRRAWCQVRSAMRQRVCLQLPSLQSSIPHHPCRPKRSRRHGPCGGPEVRCVRR